MIISECTKCPELVKTRSQIVNGYGNTKSKVIFIGICPGNHLLLGGADKSGIPFKGDISGMIFESMLKDIGMTRESVYTTNLVKCRPSDKSRCYNRQPTDSEISNCLPYAKNEIAEVKPKLVICLGKLTYKHIPDSIDATYVKVYHWHPGFLAREHKHFYPAWVNNIKHDIKKWTATRYLQSYLDII